MDLQPSQNSHDEGDRLQTSESLSGFFSRMTVSNKTMERIMRQDSNLSPYDGFRIGGIEFTGNVMEMQLIPKEEILEELSRLREEVQKEYIEIPRIFKEFAKVMAPDPIRIPRIEDRITGYKGKEKDLARVLTPQEIRQPVIGRYEGMLEIAGHEFLVAEYFAAYIDSGSGICTAKPGVFPKEARETLPVIAGRDFSQKILILNTGIREAKIMIGGAFGTPWFRVLRREKAFNRIMPINFRSKRGDFDAKLTNPKMQDKRKFGKVLLSFRQQGLIDSDSSYEESEEEIKNLREALRNFSENPLAWWDRNKIEATLKIKEECKYEYVRYKPIQMNMADKKDMQIIIKEHISLGLIEPGISAYSSPGFLIKMESESKKFTAFSTPQGILIDEAGIELQEHIVEKIRNFPDALKDKKHLQSFLGVVNFAGIFIKDLAKYRKDFRPLLKETESAKWKWEEIHTQRVRELKQVCNNLPKLAIPQDEDELVVYTDANDYRWAAVLMKKTTTGEEPCRYTGGLFTNNKPKCGTSTRRNSLQFGRLLRNGLCSYLLKNLH
ncbi:putative enzymatic polyprotein [Sesamum angolense]|uniref:Enzymatic polyprotein n=1 Tax=Sesamum angolense TaxID=2727404 RepID=A0AAE1WC27_9LAMI|nr:putative enzymatic polyprotein [Sesamum angolense]